MPESKNSKTTRNKHIFHRNWIRLRGWIRKIFHLRSDPHQIALGFALGAFIGVFPTFGLGFIVISLIAVVLKFNVPAAFLGTAIANPFLGPFWMFASYKVGKLIMDFFDSKKEIEAAAGFLTKLFHSGLDYIVGNLLISIIAGVISYFIVLKLVVWVAKKRSERRDKYKLNSSPNHKKENKTEEIQKQ